MKALLIILFSIFEILNLVVFFYQRTIRKIELKFSLEKSSLTFFYPKSYKIMLYVSYLKWVVIIIMCVKGMWWWALGCVVLGFLLTSLLPEQDDYKNLLKAREALNDNVEDYIYRHQLLSAVNEILDEMDNKS